MLVKTSHCLTSDNAGSWLAATVATYCPDRMTELPNPSQLEDFTNEVGHPVGEVFYGKREPLSV